MIIKTKQTNKRNLFFFFKEFQSLKTEQQQQQNANLFIFIYKFVNLLRMTLNHSHFLFLTPASSLF